MKRAFAAGFSFLLFATPALALADNGIPTEPTLLQLLTRVASLEAEEASIQSGRHLACAALFSAPSVKAGTQVELAWGSVGAVPQTKDRLNMWPPNGGSTLLFQKTGTWTYSFTFYGANGDTATCTAKIAVL